MRIAFAYIAEAYQAYHAAAVMFELARRDGVTIDVFHIDETTPDILEKLAKAHDAPKIASTRLAAGWAGSFIQKIKLFGLAKPQVLAANEARLRAYDAIVSTEDGIARLFAGQAIEDRPLRILITHGAGMRLVPSAESRAVMDLIIAKGAGDVEQWLARGYLREGQVVEGGYPKLASAVRMRTGSGRLFDNDRPTVLYNAHKERKERSWDRFFPALLEGFRADRSRNLIVAPHIKMFRRRSERTRRTLRALSDETILVDPGSSNLLDNTYTEAADIYVGDVSSQVAEFIARPRPCVFLNAHKADWRGNPNYALWQLGEVVNEPGEVMAAIDRAPALHDRYREAQEIEARHRLGDTSEKSVTASADLIHDFVLKHGRVR